MKNKKILRIGLMVMVAVLLIIVLVYTWNYIQYLRLQLKIKESQIQRYQEVLIPLGLPPYINNNIIKNDNPLEKYLSPIEPFVIDNLIISYKNVSMTDDETPTVQLIFSQNGKEQIIWIDQGETAEVFGYKIHVNSVGLAEGNVGFEIK
jgi:hypothetical protein